MPRTPPPRPPLVPGGTFLVQTALYAKLHNQVVLNTMYHALNTATPSSAQAAEVATGVITGILPILRLAVSNEVTWYQAIARFMGRPDIPSATVPITTGNVGAISNISLPSTDAAVITLMSAFGGKRGRGRKYIFGIPFNGEQQSSLTSAEIVLLNAVGSALIAPITTGDFGSAAPWLFSRNKVGETGVAGTPVTAYVVQTTIGTQRRRRLGRGI